MKRKRVSAITLMLLLTGMLTLAFNIQPVVGAEEPIYSRIDNPNPSTVNSTLIWDVSPTDFGTLYVLPGKSVDLVVTIRNSPLSDTTWDWSTKVFGGYWGDYGNTYWGWEIGLPDVPAIEPGSSWTGTIIRFSVFSTTPLGIKVTAEGCSLWICAITPAQPGCYKIPVTIIAGSPPPSVPVGGYSTSIQVQTITEPIIPYIALIAILTTIFTKIRPKTKRKR